MLRNGETRRFELVTLFCLMMSSLNQTDLGRSNLDDEITEIFGQQQKGTLRSASIHLSRNQMKQSQLKQERQRHTEAYTHTHRDIPRQTDSGATGSDGQELKISFSQYLASFSDRCTLCKVQRLVEGTLSTSQSKNVKNVRNS